MSSSRRRLLFVNKKSAFFQEIEYLESTSEKTQYIDTACSSNKGYRTLIDLAILGASTWTIFYGAQEEWNSDALGAEYFGFTHYTNKIGFDLGAVSVNNPLINIVLNRKYSFEVCGIKQIKHATIDGTTYTTKSQNQDKNLPTFSRYIFAENCGGNVKSNSHIRVYTNVLMYDYQGNLVRHYKTGYVTTECLAYKGTTQVVVPANTLGMMDIVENKFYVNSGTGSFVPGNNIN